MANARLIKRRIKSAQNISQITKAMELVAASKMKKAQLQAFSGKLYADKIRTMVCTLAGMADTIHHSLLMGSKQEEVQKTNMKRLGIFISTNKGLCGGLNTNLFRFMVRMCPDEQSHDWITLGQKGSVFLAQMKKTLLADFSENQPFSHVIPALTDLVIEKFTQQQYAGVDLVYNEFISALQYTPRLKRLLPIRLEDISASGAASNSQNIDNQELPFLIEPDPQEVFNELLPHYVENQIRDAILEAEASEQSARMVAMRNATDNANSLMDDLTLLYNKARQEKITYEITDMVTARLAFEGR
jgi:F-type H+-transporting ATPase subunit gamma